MEYHEHVYTALLFETYDLVDRCAVLYFAANIEIDADTITDYVQDRWPDARQVEYLLGDVFGGCYRNMGDGWDCVNSGKAQHRMCLPEFRHYEFADGLRGVKP